VIQILAKNRNWQFSYGIVFGSIFFLLQISAGKILFGWMCFPLRFRYFSYLSVSACYLFVFCYKTGISIALKIAVDSVLKPLGNGGKE
jgi:hypothetical protein